MPRMLSTCGPILMVLIAILVAGMLYGNTDTSNSNASWNNSQQHSTPNRSQKNRSLAQCNNPTGLIGDSSCCDYETVGKLNVGFSEKLHEIVNMPFFRYFKVDLYKDCPFWNGAGLCMNEDCSVETIDKSKVPEKWRSNSFSKVSIPTDPLFGSLPVKPTIREQDFCVLESGSDEVYVDLKDNPERFTGYSGPSAAMVWKAIYEENCFDVSKEMTAGCQYCESERAKLKMQQEHPESENILVPPVPAPIKAVKPSEQEMNQIFSRLPKDKDDLQKLVQGIAKDGNSEGSCLEKRVYYRLISGMHPERLENIYFDYVVLLRAVSKISDYLAGYEFCTGDESVDKNIMAAVTELVDLVKKCPPTFNEKLLFQESNDGQGRKLKNQFRDHFRNVTRIMDCVGCEKCRLWGKVQTQGLGTALKILFSYDDASLQGHRAHGILSRSEIVALINTFNRFSESISAIERFGAMYQERLEIEQNAHNTRKSFIKAPTKEEDDHHALVYK
ncbi:hypothetical protein BGX27_010685, partial [Mortierella sp. AM989]